MRKIGGSITKFAKKRADFCVHVIYSCTGNVLGMRLVGKCCAQKLAQLTGPGTGAPHGKSTSFQSGESLNGEGCKETKMSICAHNNNIIEVSYQINVVGAVLAACERNFSV